MICGLGGSTPSQGSEIPVEHLSRAQVTCGEIQRGVHPKRLM